MVKILKEAPLSDKKQSPKLPFGVLLFAIISFILYFALPPFIELDEQGNYILSKERINDYLKKPEKSESVEVYQLVAAVSGFYECLNCMGMKTIFLNSGEVWKYGISRAGKNRYKKSYYTYNKVQYIMIFTTDILNAEKMEKELIITYPLLPESQRRMKLKKIFLKRPPGNTKDQ